LERDQPLIGDRPEVADAPVAAERPPAQEGDGGDLLLKDWIDYINLRVRLIGEHEKARAMLVREWPSGVPVPRKIEDQEQIDKVIPVLNFVESECSLGFVEQPTALQSTGHYKKGT
jgi:hypothetical protein